MISEIEVKDLGKAIGKYIIVYKQVGSVRVKQVAKVLSFNPGEKKIIYELVMGKEKGKKFESKCDAATPVKVYEEEDLTVALLEA